MILVVDDIQVNRQLLSRSIRRLGYPVVLASDGARAITILEDNRDIGCVVTDLMMPGINGRELIQSIRGTPGLSTIPVLVYSAVGSAEEIEEVVAWGATAVLEHPVDPVTLANHVDHYALRRTN